MNGSQWFWLKGHELSVPQFHSIFQLRARVFVVEQNCPYLDIDNQDLDASHLFLDGTTRPSVISAYLRILPLFESTLVIGRVIVDKEQRGIGLGRQLMKEAHRRALDLPFERFKLSAQAHLQSFYESLGYQKIGSPYDEDGIPHIQMICPKQQAHI